MKRLLLFSLIGIGCLVVYAGKLIEYPENDTNELNLQIGINSVELNDTATLFDVSFYHHHGYWIMLNPATKLVGRATGKEYAIKSVRGLELGKKTYVPFSGYISSQISFEPLVPADSIVDFIEPDGWKVTGIKLYDTTEGKIKTNVSGTVDSDLVSCLMFFTDEGLLPGHEYYLVPVRDGKFNYDLYTESPKIFNVIVGLNLWEEDAKIKRFRAEGEPVIINYEYEELDPY